MTEERIMDGFTDPRVLEAVDRLAWRLFSDIHEAHIQSASADIELADEVQNMCEFLRRTAAKMHVGGTLDAHAVFHEIAHKLFFYFVEHRSEQNELLKRAADSLTTWDGLAEEYEELARKLDAFNEAMARFGKERLGLKVSAKAVVEACDDE